MKRPSLALCLLLSAGGLLGGCSKQAKTSVAEDPSQIAALVNDGEISIHQVQAVLQAQPGVGESLGQQASTRVLDSLIEQELAAQAARKAGLDSLPKVLQALELAKREVLARAYQDSLAERAAYPNDQAVADYYELHPELFAHRRVYTLQEMSVQASREQAEALLKKIKAVNGGPAVSTVVEASGLPYSIRTGLQASESLPMDLLNTLAKLRNGESIGVARPDGLLIMTVVKSEEVPAPLKLAERAIRAALLTQRRQELVRASMAKLREQARIERKGAFARAAGAAQTASAASDAASGGTVEPATAAAGSSAAEAPGLLAGTASGGSTSQPASAP